MSADTWWAVFGWVSSALIVFSLLQSNMVWLRVFNLIGCVLAVIYNTPLAVWPSVGLNAAISIINAAHLIKLRRDRVRAEAEQAAIAHTQIRTDPDDRVARALLEQRRDEVERRGGDRLNALLETSTAVTLVFHGATLVACALHRNGEDLWVHGEQPQAFRH